MTVIRELYVFLGLDTDDADFRKAEKAVDNLTKLAKGATVAVGAIGAALGFAGHTATREANQLERWRQITGDTIENLSALKIAAETLGIEGEKAFEGISEVAERASDIVENIKNLTGDAGESFKSLGFDSFLELTDGRGNIREARDLFDDVIGRLALVENRALRTGIAMRLFGDDTGLAIASIPLDQLVELQSEVRTLGLVMTGDGVAAARRFSVAFGGVRAILRAFAIDIGVQVLPAVEELLLGFRRWILANRDVIKTEVGPVIRDMAKALGIGVKAVQRFVEILGEGAELVGGWRNLIRLAGAATLLFATYQLGALAMALQGPVAAGFASAVLWLKAYTGWVFLAKGASTQLGAAQVALAAKTLLLGAALVALGFLIEDVVGHLQGKQSLIGRLLELFDPAGFDPEDTLIVKGLRLIVGLIKEASRFASLGYTALFGGSGDDADVRFARNELKNFFDAPEAKQIARIAGSTPIRYLPPVAAFEYATTGVSAYGAATPPLPRPPSASTPRFQQRTFAPTVQTTVNVEGNATAEDAERIAEETTRRTEDLMWRSTLDEDE